MRTGVVDLPLHSGRCPPWLFSKMKRLSGLIIDAIVSEYGTGEFLKRISDPMFFQALSCVLGFDWHSSGTTTTTCGALKEAINEKREESTGSNVLGLAVCGGKGKTSKKTISEIEQFAEAFSLSDSKIAALQKASRLTAKVDSACIQDGYELYHHVLFFDEHGEWAVVQQGMNKTNSYARRYHWATTNKFVDDPPDQIIGIAEQEVLTTVSKKSSEMRKASVDIVKDNPLRFRKYFDGQTTLFGTSIIMPRHHEIRKQDLTEKDWKFLESAYEYQPKNYEELIALRGMGGKKIRALALLAKLLYGTELDWKDPIKYSWAHGGKDGFPFPVDYSTYENSINFLSEIINKNEEKKEIMKKLSARASI